MRLPYICFAAALALAPAAAFAQSSPSGPPTAGAAAPKAAYSSTDTEVGALLDDPAAKAVVEKHVPGFTTNEQVDMARAMTLKDVQQYAPEQLTDKVLAAIDADLAKLPTKK